MGEAEEVAKAEREEHERQMAEHPMVELEFTPKGNLSVETGVSFATPEGNRWLTHKVAIDADYVSAHLDTPALDNFDELTLSDKLLVVRAVTELSVARFRGTRHDPDYDDAEYSIWVQVITAKVGTEGTERLGW